MYGALGAPNSIDAAIHHPNSHPVPGNVEGSSLAPLVGHGVVAAQSAGLCVILKWQVLASNLGGKKKFQWCLKHPNTSISWDRSAESEIQVINCITLLNVQCTRVQTVHRPPDHCMESPSQLVSARHSSWDHTLPWRPVNAAGIYTEKGVVSCWLTGGLPVFKKKKSTFVYLVLYKLGLEIFFFPFCCI